MDDFEKELKMGFIEEATQLLGDVEQCFLVLESNPQDTATLEKIFRIAHNIKGSSRAVGFDKLGAFTHEFETFLLKCKSGQIPITPKTISLFLKCTDHIKETIEQLRSDPGAVLDSSSLVSEIQQFSIEDTANPAAVPEPAPESTGPVQEEIISSEEIALLQKTEEFALPSPQKNAPMPPPAIEKKAVAAQADESIRVSLSRLEKLLNFVGELVILQTVLKEQVYSTNPQTLRRTIHQMGKVTKEVQDLSMGLRMIPIKQTFQKMQRIVRDTSSVLGKKVQLILEGEETEVDKTVLEVLGDPLVHLVRNSVDHGIESPADRLAKGKPESGKVILRAFHQSDKLVIEVKDDGGGISADRLRQKAIEKGILKPNQNISDKEAINLVFHPGFSTKAVVTEVSGRGVGMDVVKTNIEQVQGEVLIDTALGQGSTFKILLPLTLAIIDGMIVRSGTDRFIIPLSHVHESLKPEAKDIKNTTAAGEVLLLRGENLPIVRISKALGKSKHPKEQEQIAIIVRTQAKPFAAHVDDVIGQHQVVIKKLGSEVKNIKGYSGSAILGDGKPALILELADLVLGNQTRQVA